MIGTPENDAALRLECWKVGMAMARQNQHDHVVVDKMATAVYAFIANGANVTTAPVTESRDKSTKTPKR